MKKIRVLSDHVANQIAAGEVVERPASVAKELVENSIDAGARRVEVEVEAGGRRLLRVIDDGEGMSRDDAVLAFERHATSKISGVEDLERIGTLGFRGEALASIASVARVELVTKTADDTEATRVLIEGGKLRDVVPAARPVGTTITARDLFFNVPARRKFLRSEATETFHLTNLVMHYALAHPEIAFVLTVNGRETLRAAAAPDLRERAYQIFGADFLENLLPVNGGNEYIALVRGFVSAPRERRTTRDAQYLFVNGRFVRDRLISRSLSEAYRSVLPHGVYPAALLFLELPLEEVDVNVHPAKTEVRFRRAAAVADTVREAVRAGLATGGYVRLFEKMDDFEPAAPGTSTTADATTRETPVGAPSHTPPSDAARGEQQARSAPRQEAIEFGFTPPDVEMLLRDERGGAHERAQPLPQVSHEEGAIRSQPAATERRQAGAAGDMPADSPARVSEDVIKAGDQARAAGDQPQVAEEGRTSAPASPPASEWAEQLQTRENASPPSAPSSQRRTGGVMPPVVSAAGLVREVAVESLTANIRPLGQLEESYIVATDVEGLLLIDQHVAHERVLFDKYRRLETSRNAESQQLLIPETFDLTPTQAAAFDLVSAELESYGFGLMRLSGRTVAIKAVPAELPSGEARNMLAEVLDTVDAEKRGAARATMRDEIAASLACHAAIKVNMPLTPEKMRWLIDRLLTTSSPTTCPHGRPVILRLSLRDIEKGFHRS